MISSLRSIENGAILFLLLAYPFGLFAYQHPDFRFIAEYSADIINLCTDVLVLLVLYRKNKARLFIPTIGGAYALSFLSEQIGVHTGWLFGNYQYGDGFLFQFNEVPLIIGLNWVTLTLATSSLAALFFKGKRGPFLAAALVTGFDYLMEPGAIALNYWSWDGGAIPLTNYITWFLLAWFLSTIYQWVGLDLRSKLLLVYLAVQTGFFALL